MIEAVNSVVSNAPLLRSGSEQLDASRTNVAAIQAQASLSEVREAPQAPQAPYISPYIEVDVQFDTAVLQIRDSDTGDVLRQFPSESRLESIRKQRAEEAISRTESRQSAPQTQNSNASVESQQRVGASFASLGAISTPESPSSSVSVAQAQQAAAALSAGANAGQTSTSLATSA